MGYKYAKFTLNDTLVCQIATPYVDTDLMEIHYRQIGNTMWLVHSNYSPQKITRESSTLFSINEIVFNYGPFLIQNDLIDDSVNNTAYMIYSGSTDINSLGNLKCCQSDGTTEVSFFDALQVGALFKLITKRTDTVSAWSFNATNYTFNGITTWKNIVDGTSVDLDAFLAASQVEVKGTFTFTTSNFIPCKRL